MIAVNKIAVRRPSGRIIGFIETDKDGNKQARNFYGKILGTYDKRLDVTRDFYGRIVTRGDSVMGFVYEADGSKNF